MSEVYYGTKRISAELEIKDGNHGYGVVYEDGYKSWSPRSTFEACYRRSGEMNFGHALQALDEGLRVARSGWNGRGMCLFRVPGSTVIVSDGRPMAKVFPVGTRVEYRPHIDIKAVDGTVAPWIASQTDLLADDWGIVE